MNEGNKPTDTDRSADLLRWCSANLRDAIKELKHMNELKQRAETENVLHILEKVCDEIMAHLDERLALNQSELDQDVKRRYERKQTYGLQRGRNEKSRETSR
jgi:hypothetical protein